MSRYQTRVSFVEWFLLIVLIAVVVMAFVSLFKDDRPIFDTMPQSVTSTSTPTHGG